MSRGRRYNYEGQQLNVKKVAGLILVIAIIIAILVAIIKGIVTSNQSKVDEKAVTNGYFTVFTGNKWGVINSKGNKVIDPIYDAMVVVPDYTKPLFFVQTNIDQEKETFEAKAINEKSEQQFTEYSKVELFQNKNADGSIYFDSSAIKVMKDGKYGMINFEGKVLLPCEYEDVRPVSKIKNSFITVKDGKLGLVDQSGNTIVENKYKEISALTNKYEDGYILKDDSEKCGVVNYSKKMILECKYNEIKHVTGSGYYVVKDSDGQAIIDANGKVTTRDFDVVYSINSGNAIIEKGGKIGVITVNGDKKVDAKYNAMTYLFEGYYAATLYGKTSIVDSNDKTKLSGYKSVTYFSDEGFIKAEKEDGTSDLIGTDFEIKVNGLVSEINKKKSYIKVRKDDTYKYYNFKLEEKTIQEVLPANTLYLKKENGKYGYVNKNGKVAVEIQFDDAKEQNDFGYSAVKKNGKWGVIDSTGKMIVDFKYTLENNTVIDFIGNYHLAPDLNAYYYTDVEE